MTMKKLITYLTLLILIFSTPSFAKHWIMPAYDGTTGGTAGKLDAIDVCTADGAGYDVQDKDAALVWNQTAGTFSLYIFDIDSAAAESDPSIIAPDFCDAGAYSGDGRWLLSYPAMTSTGADAIAALIDSGTITWSQISKTSLQLTDFADQTAWRIFYSDTNGDITELALGAANTFLGSDGLTSAPSFQALVDADIPSAIDPDKIGPDGTANDKVEAANVNIQSLDIGLTSAYIFVGNGSNLAAGVTMSGGARVDNTGLVTPYVNTVTDANGFTMTAAQGYGYVVYATGAGTIVMPAAVAGMQFTVECHAAAAVVLNPDATGTEDTIRLDGTALAVGDSITSLSAAGDIAVCTYYAADTWSCITNGWTDTN